MNRRIETLYMKDRAESSRRAIEVAGKRRDGSCAIFEREGRGFVIVAGAGLVLCVDGKMRKRHRVENGKWRDD